MSLRYQAGVLSSFYNGLKVPNAPTIGTATASGLNASITFTAPSCTGGSVISSYTAVSNCGAFIGTSATSPVTVSSLTPGSSYTFRIFATNIYGASPYSASSNSISPVATGQEAYTTAGTYSWVAPAGVTSVSIVAVGGGGAGSGQTCCFSGGVGGGGGGLGYKNNYAVTAGNSYTVVVGGTGVSHGGNAGDSYFVSTATVKGGGGGNPYVSGPLYQSGPGGTYTGDGGGNGGNGGTSNSGGVGGGGGAGGYAGTGGAGLSSAGQGTAGNAGTGGAGGGAVGNKGGGGVGILGQGANGAGGCAFVCRAGQGGSGGGNGGTPIDRSGGVYGGGSGASGLGKNVIGASGGVGAVRIIWPGTTRSFPSTNTGNL